MRKSLAVLVFQNDLLLTKITRTNSSVKNLKTVEGASPPGVRIPISPPVVNCTHRCENGECVQFFFLYEYFGVAISFTAPKIDNAGWYNYLAQKEIKMEISANNT